MRTPGTRPLVAHLSLLFLLLPLVLRPGSWAANGKTVLTARGLVQVRTGYQDVVDVRSHLTAEWGLTHPTGLTYLPDEGSFLVAGPDRRGPAPAAVAL